MTDTNAIKTALEELKTAKSKHHELYLRRDEFKARHTQLTEELANLEDGSNHITSGSVDKVLKEAAKRRKRMETIKDELQTIDAAISALESNFFAAREREGVAEQVLQALRNEAAQEALQALRTSREFDKFAARVREVMAVAMVAAHTRLGGRLDEDSFYTDVLDGIEPEAKHLKAAAKVLMVED